MVDLRFDLDLYDEAAVRAAVHAFAEHADLQVDGGPGALRISGRALEGTDAEDLPHALAQYALVATIELRRGVGDLR